MTKRQWTVMIVPHGSDAPRAIAVTERVLRALAWTGSVLLLLTVVGIGVAVSRGSRMLATAYGDESVVAGDVLRMRREMLALRDTVEALSRRDVQLRLAAGLPVSDSAAGSLAGDSVVVSSAAGSPGAAPGRPGSPIRRLAEMARVDLDAMINQANMLSASFAIVSDTLAHNRARLANLPSIMPTTGWLTSNFSRSRFHPILHIRRPHEGIDVAAPMGAPIVAPADGVVIRAERESGYGLVVEIDHGNGIVTKYAHCSSIAVRPGQRVTRGKVIAAVGSSGLASGPHLHYEIHVNGKVVDPQTFVLPGAIPD